MNKKISNIKIAAYIGAILLVFVASILFGSKKVDANPSNLNAFYTNATTSPDYLPRTAPSLYNGGSATGKYVEFKLTSSGTSTLTFSLDGADSFYVPAQLIASSTATVLNLKIAYSYDGSNWFNEDAATVTSNILQAHSSTTVNHTWQPSTTATSTKLYSFPNTVGAKYGKVFLDVTGANGTLWYAVFTKTQKN